jgi:hypothetical protein
MIEQYDKITIHKGNVIVSNNQISANQNFNEIKSSQESHLQKQNQYKTHKQKN